MDLLLAIIAGVVAGRALAHVLGTLAWVLWMRFAYTRRTAPDYFLRGPLFLGRFEEGVYLPLWAGVLRRIFEGRPR